VFSSYHWNEIKLCWTSKQHCVHPKSLRLLSGFRFYIAFSSYHCNWTKLCWTASNTMYSPKACVSSLVSKFINFSWTEGYFSSYHWNKTKFCWTSKQHCVQLKSLRLVSGSSAAYVSYSSQLLHETPWSCHTTFNIYSTTAAKLDNKPLNSTKPMISSMSFGTRFGPSK
jgi:hypothetical protein